MRIFDAALLCYTFQGMPIRSESEKVLKLIYKKLSTRSYVLWMSRWGDAKTLPDDQRVLHGHYKYDNLTSGYHSFYAEFRTEAIHAMMASVGWRKEFRYLKSLGQGGRDQIFVYSKRAGEAFCLTQNTNEDHQEILQIP